MRSLSIPAARAETASDAGTSLFSGLQRLPHLKDATDGLIAEALRRTDGNQTLAAKLLGMTRTALNKRLIRSEKYD